MEFLIAVLAVYLIITVVVVLDSKAQQGNPPKPSPVWTLNRPLSYPSKEDINAVNDEIYRQRVEIAKVTADKARPCINSNCSGKYKETSIYDDWDGVLHCDRCKNKTQRWKVDPSLFKDVTESDIGPPKK